MNNILKYYVYKNDTIIKEGFSTSWYVHGMIASILQEDNADYINLIYDNGSERKLYSPKVLFKMKPDSVSEVDHKKWFSGNRYNL